MSTSAEKVTVTGDDSSEDSSELSQLSSKQQRAIPLLVEDDLTDEKIAAKVGVAVRTLHKWKKQPQFDAAFHAELADWCARIRSSAYSMRERRLKVLTDIAKKYIKLLEERGYDVSVADIAGGSTGLIVQRERVIGTGPKAEKVTEYEADVAVTRELRATLDQIRDEMGQKVQHADVTSDGKPVVMFYLPQPDPLPDPTE